MKYCEKQKRTNRQQAVWRKWRCGSQKELCKFENLSNVQTIVSCHLRQGAAPLISLQKNSSNSALIQLITQSRCCFVGYNYYFLALFIICEIVGAYPNNFSLSLNLAESPFISVLIFSLVIRA